MNRSRRQETLATSLPVLPGEAVVATAFGHPSRGQVVCPSAALLGGALRRRGLDVRYAPFAATAEGAVPVRAVTYLGRDETPSGLAVACRADVEAEVAACAEVMRTRRIVLGAPDPRCEGAREHGAQAAGLCPLALSARDEVLRFASRGDTVLVVGREGHAVLPVLLDAAPPGGVLLVEDVGGVHDVRIDDPARVAVVLQPGLPVEDTGSVAVALRERFPLLVPQDPKTVCYAASDRRSTIRELASFCDALIVAGAPDPEDTALHAAGMIPLHFAAGPEDIRPEWLAGTASVGITAARGADPALARELAAALTGLGPAAAVERRVGTVELSPVTPSSTTIPGRRT